MDYEDVDVLIELNNNYCGNYMRNLLYAFNIILNHYQKGTKDKDLVKKRAKLILVNLNWYPLGANYNKIDEKVESYLAYPEDNTNDYIIKTVSINLDRYKDFCYDKVSEWDKLWKLLTIEDDKELVLFIKNEKLLKRYEKKLFNLSKNEEYAMILMDEEIERNAMMAQSYQGGYRNGIEQGINQMIMNMYKEKVPVEVISKCANLDISDVKRIIEENSKEN